MNTAIQKHEPSIIDTLTNSQWTRDVFEVIRKLRVPKGCTEEEFFVYLKQCQASGLNPLLGHAYCVPRRTNVGSKQSPQWVTNHVFQPAIDGMRARAAEFPDFDMVDSAPIYKNDRCIINKGTGDVVHESAPTGNRGPLIGAWGRVRKTTGKAAVVELPVTARSGSGDFWAGDPGGMLAKCCEAAALRKAYPRAFGGMHIAEEMPAETQGPTRAEVVLGVSEVPKQEAPALPPPSPVVEFGEWRDRFVSTLTEDEKRAAVEYAEEQVKQHPKMGAKAKAKLTENIALIRASMAPKPAAEDAEEVPPAPVSHSLTDPDAEPPPDMRLPGEEG